MADYGLIIIGAGMTGMSAGIAWLKNTGGRAVIIEKEPKAGGCVTSYGRQGFLFDTCQFVPNPFDVLSYLGVEVDLVKLSGNFLKLLTVDTATGAVNRVEIPSGFAEFRAFMTRTFPADSRAIGRFLDHCRGMYGELVTMKLSTDPLSLVSTMIRCPKVVLNSGKTFEQYMSGFGIKDPGALSIFTAFADFSSMPCCRAAALLECGAMNTSLDGAYRPRKGFIQLPNAMRRRFEELGGEFRFNAAAASVIIEGGVARGVRLEDGTTIMSDNIITTIDPKVAMGKLVGYELLEKLDKKYADKARSVRMSPSSFNMALGLDEGFDPADRGFDGGYTVLTTGKSAVEELFRAFDGGRNGMSPGLFRLGIISPSSVTGARNTLMIGAYPFHPDEWINTRAADPRAYAKKKQETAAMILDIVEKYAAPGLREHIEVMDIATPATYARYLGSPTGSIYDMSPYIDNFGLKRLAMRTPVKGLYQPKFSHGVWPCLQAGLQAADALLGGKIMHGNARYSKAG